MDVLVEDLKDKNPISSDLVMKMKAAELQESMDGIYRQERIKGVRYPKVDMDKIDYIFKAIKDKKLKQLGVQQVCSKHIYKALFYGLP